MDLYHIWRDLQENEKKTQDAKRMFLNILNNIFGIAHADALQRIKIDVDRIFYNDKE